MIYQYGIQYITGPRQSGKTTKCMEFCKENNDKQSYVITKRIDSAKPFIKIAMYKQSASNLRGISDCIIIFDDFYYIDSGPNMGTAMKANMKDILELSRNNCIILVLGDEYNMKNHPQHHMLFKTFEEWVKEYPEDYL